MTHEIIHLPSAAAEIALPERLVDAARHYMAEARSKRTREAYGRAWAQFQCWCTANGRLSLPASAETVAAWMTALADGDDGRPPRARATINQYLSAVVIAQRAAGHSFDRKHPLIAGGVARHLELQGQVRGRAPGPPHPGFDDGQALLIACMDRGIEGVVSKKRDAPYRSGSRPEWVKAKSPGWRAANQNRGEMFRR